MPSSTFNSDAGSSAGVATLKLRCRRDRISLQTVDSMRVPIALGLAAAAVLVFAAARPGHSTVGLSETEYDRLRASWRANMDIVLAGDSRVQLGLSPEAMQEDLYGQRMCNYAFEACGFSDEYLLSIERLLARDRIDPIVVLGITPYSLTANACSSNGFIKRNQRPAKNRRVSQWINVESLHLGPLTAHEIKVMFGHAHQAAFQAERTTTGWIAVHRAPTSQVGELASYRTIFSSNKVSYEVVVRLNRRVRLWQSQGIMVFGVRLPISPEMYGVERELSGFDETTFASLFTRAGGIWLGPRQGVYSSYDGSHLDCQEATRFSRDLAEQIAAWKEHHAPANVLR